MIKINKLGKGCIIWSGDSIIGVVGITLDMDKYGEMCCYNIHGNIHDYELVKDGN